MIVAALMGTPLSSYGVITIPSDGSDGALSPAVDTVIDLSQAVPGTWSDDNAGGDIGKGVYDVDQWAVVFEYSSVNIPAGVTVSFADHPSKAPVIWLVSGSVNIEGTIDLKGGSVYVSGLEGLVPTSGGPGGFRGGAAGPEGTGDGLGIGGAGSTGGDGFPVYQSGIREYGNPQILPLMGGSGGQGTGNTAGAGGGGAIMIACANTISLDGTINSSGGNSLVGFNGHLHRGSGGAIRLIADQIDGSGLLDCRGGYWSMESDEDTSFNQGGSVGRIRIETANYSPNVTMYPETVAVAPAIPPQIFPPVNAPTVKILSVDSLTAPADPNAPLSTSADIAIQNDAPITVTLETRNFPLEGVVQLRVGSKFGNAVFLTATYESGNSTVATWTVTHTFTDGFTSLQARATAP